MAGGPRLTTTVLLQSALLAPAQPRPAPASRALPLRFLASNWRPDHMMTMPEIEPWLRRPRLSGVRDMLQARAAGTWCQPALPRDLLSPAQRGPAANHHRLRSPRARRSVPRKRYPRRRRRIAADPDPSALQTARSVIVTSNRVVQDWETYLGDNTMSTTILDRLMHQVPPAQVRWTKLSPQRGR